MKVYGLTIGDNGIEFPTQYEREKAINAFVAGSTTKVNSTGIKYKEHGKHLFGTYERDTDKTYTICCECGGEFTHDICYDRQYNYVQSYSSRSIEDRTAFICDKCLEAKHTEVNNRRKQMVAESSDKNV